MNRVTSSIAFYPLTAFYCAAVTVVVGDAQGWFRVDLSLVALTLMAILLLLATMRHEVTVVHDLVDSQRERIDQLVGALEKVGAAVPPNSGRGGRSGGR